MTGFLVNLLSPVFSSLGVSQADLTSYIEKLIGYVIAIFALLVVMIVVMVVAHKAKKGFRHVIRWQAAIAFIAIVAVLVNVICYGPMYLGFFQMAFLGPHEHEDLPVQKNSREIHVSSGLPHDMDYILYSG